jgi:hypothetical protein
VQGYLNFDQILRTFRHVRLRFGRSESYDTELSLPPIPSDLPVTGFAGFGWEGLGYVRLSDIGLRIRSLHMGRRIHPCTEVPDNNYVKVRM